jgi:putative ABC transport system permease protein
MRLYRLAWRNVLRNRRRSLVTVIIAAIGCAAVELGGGFAIFTYDALMEGSICDSGHMTVASKDYFEKDEETPMQNGIDDAHNLVLGLSQQPQVHWVLPHVNFSGLVSNGDKSVIFNGIGVDPVLEPKARSAYLTWVAGSFGRSPDGQPVALLGSELAKSLNVKVGSSLTLVTTTTQGSMNAMDVTVSGIASTGWHEVDQHFLYTDIESAQRLLDTNRVSDISVYLNDTATTAAVVADLSSRDSMHVYRPWWQQAPYYHSVRALYDRIFGLLGCIIATLVFFSVSNTLTMAVVERTREIGTLRALGAEPGEVVAQFVREGLLIGLTSALIGTILATAIALLLPYTGLQMPPPPGRSVGYSLKVTISPLLDLIAAVSVTLLCAAAAWLASYRATRQPIFDALGHV